MVLLNPSHYGHYRKDTNVSLLIFILLHSYKQAIANLYNCLTYFFIIYKKSVVALLNIVFNTIVHCLAINCVVFVNHYCLYNSLSFSLKISSCFHHPPIQVYINWLDPINILPSVRYCPCCCHVRQLDEYFCVVCFI